VLTKTVLKQMEEKSKQKFAKRRKKGFEITLLPPSPEATSSRAPNILEEMTSQFSWDEQSSKSNTQEMPSDFEPEEPRQMEKVEEEKILSETGILEASNIYEELVEMSEVGPPEEIVLSDLIPDTQNVEEIALVESPREKSNETQTEYCAQQSCEAQTDEPPEKSTVNVETQTPPKNEELTQLKLELEKCVRENVAMRKNLAELQHKTFHIFDLNVNALKANDTLVELYTGVPNFQQLRTFYESCSKFVAATDQFTIPRFNEFLMVMMKIRMNVTYKDLAVRFKTTESLATAFCVKWIHGMYRHAKTALYWPSSASQIASVSRKFSHKYGRQVVAILDSFEVLIPKPLNDEACLVTWNPHMKRHTIKYLISVTPQGKINFLSDGWGGVVTDKQITEECGFLDFLERGDKVLTERDFVEGLEERLGTLGCGLIECDKAEEGAQFHVQKVVGTLQKMFPILAGEIPMYLLTEKADNGMPLIDKITTICCALLNLYTSVVEEQFEFEEVARETVAVKKESSI